MNAIILADTASAEEILDAICEFVTPIRRTQKRLFVKEDFFVSSDPGDMTGQSIVLINGDIPLGKYCNLLEGHPVITYGCNPKATVTASSICENKLMCCVQRPLIWKGFCSVLPQEFSVSCDPCSVSSLLGAICVLLLSFGETFFL